MFLVTTAEESTWDNSKEICYLGEWCRRYSRKKTWEKINSYVVPYHWNNREKYNRDYYYLDDVYERSLVQLSNNLDRINYTFKGIDYWRIVVGPWLRFFIDVLFDRYETIHSAYKLGVVDNTWILPYELNDWVSDGFKDFFVSINDDKWNHILYAECIRAIGLPHSEKPNGIALKPRVNINNSEGIKKILIRKILETYQNLIPSGLNRHVAVSPYFPRKYVARFQLALRQLPYLISPSENKYDSPVDIEKRGDLSINISDSPFELLLGKLIPRLMPKAYLEDFSKYCTTELNKFPKAPLTIFTANAYQANDNFKYWAAEYQKEGVPLIIGQHGGNLGMAHHNQTEDHQLKIADSYCSWGWAREGIDSINPMPSLQLSNINLSDNLNGGILLVLASYPRYFYCHCSTPVAGQFLKYLNQQVQLINGLDAQARPLINIRLNGDEYGWDIVDRLKDAGMDKMIDASSDRFMLAVSKYKLCIVSYNATVILETMNANFPTIAYWDPELFDVRPDALPYVNMLRKVGILHDTVESASQLINEIHHDIQSWWQRPELQTIRHEFCIRYANSSDNWVEIWKKHLYSVKRKHTQ
jgi:putative transferase (TIGR04331 family)